VDREHLYGINYICSAAEMVFFDKCVTADFKNLRKYVELAILINVMGQSYDIKTRHKQDFATKLFQFHDFIF